MSIALTPFAFRILGISDSGICFSVIMKSRGSSENSKSSTIACLMLMLCCAIMVATSASIPGVLGSFGMISITPQCICDATSLRWPVGSRFENILLRSDSFVMVCIVEVITRLSTEKARAILDAESSMSPQ